MKAGNLYSASDKALADAIAQTKVTKADIFKLFLTHGIIVSEDTTRRELAKYYSRLIHDYEDFQALALMFDPGTKRERTTSLRVKSSAKLSDFEAAAIKVADAIHDDGDLASIEQIDANTFRMKIKYKTYHFNKSEFRQVVEREAVVTLEKDKDAIVIRGPQNLKVDTWCQDIVRKVEEQIEQAVEVDTISLAYEKSPDIRSQFFKDLTTSMDGFKRHDVTDVYAFKPKEKKEDIDDGDHEDDIEVDLGVHITKATLKGEGVLQSDEMANLTAKGFYISKIIWQSKKASFDSDIYEFEAQFSNPEFCTEFSYLPRGFYAYQENGQHNVSRHHFQPAEERELSQAIELSARGVIEQFRQAQAITSG